jgi:hypothetical protein
MFSRPFSRRVVFACVSLALMPALATSVPAAHPADPPGPVWIPDNHAGKSTLYDGAGTKPEAFGFVDFFDTSGRLIPHAVRVSFSELMSITKRYFTSFFTSRS